jgi:hypothetical protein
MADLFAMGRNGGDRVLAAAIVAQSESVMVLGAHPTHGTVAQEVKIFPLSRPSLEEEHTARWSVSSWRVGSGSNHQGAATLYGKACLEMGKKAMEFAETADTGTITETCWNRTPDGVVMDSVRSPPLYVPHFVTIRHKSAQQDVVTRTKDAMLASSFELQNKFREPRWDPIDTVRLAVPVSTQTTRLQLLPYQSIGPFALDPCCRHTIENESTVALVVQGKHFDGYLKDEPRFRIILHPKGRVCIQNIRFEVSICSMTGPPLPSGGKKKRKSEGGPVAVTWCTVFGDDLDRVPKVDGFLKWAATVERSSIESERAEEEERSSKLGKNGRN